MPANVALRNPFDPNVNNRSGLLAKLLPTGLWFTPLALIVGDGKSSVTIPFRARATLLQGVLGRIGRIA